MLMDAAPRASLLSLPLECRQAVLVQLHDVSSLWSAVLSHSALYTAFTSRKNYILKAVLRNLVSPDLLPGAFALVHASRVQRWDRQNIDENREKYCCRHVPNTVTLKDAAFMEKFHRSAEFFASDFASTALSKHPLTGVATTSGPVTSTEWHRILRCFYRHEFYVVSYGRLWKSTPRGHHATEFLRNFSIWELEQLASIGEYLFHKLSKPFNEVAAHDIEWGAYEFSFDAEEIWESRWPHHVKGFWIGGLVFLQQLVTAGTYEERYRLLQSKFLVENSIQLSREALGAQDLPGFLAVHSICYAPEEREARARSNYLIERSYHLSLEALDTWFLFDDEDPRQLQDYSENEVHAAIGNPFSPEPDKGPVEAWKWTHQTLSHSEFLQSEKLRYLRRRGYVMWDYSRLRGWGFFGPSWTQYSGDMPSASQSEEDALHDVNHMERSWQRRKSLYQRGARGWWDESDETRVQWASGNLALGSEDV